MTLFSFSQIQRRNVFITFQTSITIIMRQIKLSILLYIYSNCQTLLQILIRVINGFFLILILIKILFQKIIQEI